MSDRTPDSGLTVWIALRRAHEGGVANLAGRWLDSGRRVPGYVADALDGLTSAGLLALGEVDHESCGVRRVTVTDNGSARYVALCQIHKPRARVAVGTPRRWACSPHDQRSHLLAERGPDQIGIQVAVCGRRMPWSVDTSAQPTERNCLTCEALATGPVPAPQFGNPPDSGRPPVEQFPQPIPAPGGRPDTTAPVGLRRGSPGAGQVVINPCVQLPLINAEPGAGSSLRLAVALMLQRVHGGAAAKLGEGYWDRVLPTTGHLVGAFDELTAAGLLVLADPDPHGLRRVTLTIAGHTRYEQLVLGTPRPTGAPVPAAQFAAIKIPARERLSGPRPLVPFGQPNTHRPGESGVGPLRWTRCPDQGRLHLLAPTEVVVAVTGGHAEAVCGRALPVQSLTLTNGSSGAVCMACVAGIPSDPADPSGPRGTP